MMYNVHAPRVLIVGGGLVGLSAALFLQYHGVAAVLVERRTTTSPQPKARRINIRTMELFRQIGIADEVEDASRDLAAYQHFAAGPSLAEAARLPFTLPGGVPDWATITPASACLCAQDLLEPVLRRIAVDRGCAVRFGVELTDFAEHADGVEATLRTTDGTVERLRADYLIAADGAGSPIRERLGIRRGGRGTLGRAVNIYFRADLSEVVRGREFNLCQIESPSTPGAFASIDGSHRWIFSTSEGIDRPVEEWPAVLRTAIGVSDIELDVLSVLPWEPGMFVAEKYRHGRILLAGDAAHVMPPFAAAGANTGIEDAHNLAWKLAFVLRGIADPALLDSYHQERHPVGWFIADQSSIRTADLRTMNRESADDTPLADPIAMILGNRYRAGALIDDGSPSTMDHLDRTGHSGTRLLHRRLADGRSTLDLIGTGCVLLIGPAGTAWKVAAQDHPLEVHELDQDWTDTVGISATGALLVRPDQIIGWRAPALPADPAAALTESLDRILARPKHSTASDPGLAARPTI